MAWRRRVTVAVASAVVTSTSTQAATILLNLALGGIVLVTTSRPFRSGRLRLMTRGRLAAPRCGWQEGTEFG